MGCCGAVKRSASKDHNMLAMVISETTDDDDDDDDDKRKEGDMINNELLIDNMKTGNIRQKPTTALSSFINHTMLLEPSLSRHSYLQIPRHCCCRCYCLHSSLLPSSRPFLHPYFQRHFDWQTDQTTAVPLSPCGWHSQ